MKKNDHKLAVKRSTLRSLTDGQLVSGGIPPTYEWSEQPTCTTRPGFSQKIDGCTAL